VLASAGAAALVGVAGCVGGDDSAAESADDSESAGSNGQANGKNGEGSTEEWKQEKWGWVEQMENVNLSSLQTALNRE
jgi:hypothetical protein